MRICEILVSCLNEDSEFSDDEYRLITHCARELEKEIFIYRVQKYASRQNS
jgi:hypothetical protein